MKEIEILFRVAEPIGMIQEKLSAYTYEGMEQILDIYFTHPAIEDLQPVNGEICTSLRIRQKAGKTFLTHKRNHMQDGKYLYADEEEVEVSSFEKTVLLVQGLGFSELVRVENRRRTYVAGEYEIVVDEVKGLGLLLEIEHKMPGDRPAEEILEEMRGFLNKIGITIGEELNLGKPELLLKKERTGQSF